MPNVFKTLTSISIWILFIHGLLAIAWGGADMFIFTGGWTLTPMAAISCSIGSANLIMAVVAVKLRKMME